MFDFNAIKNIYFIIPLFIGIISSIAVIIYLLKFKYLVKYKTGVFLFCGIIIWLAGYTLELLCTNFDIKILLSKIEFIGIVIIPVTFFILTLDFSGYGNWITRKKVVLLFAIPVLTMILIFTNEFHGLIWKILDKNVVVGLPINIVKYGYWFWVSTFYLYSLLLISYFFLIKTLLNKFKIFKIQSVLLIGALTIPFIADILYLTEIIFEITPLTLVISSLALIFGFTKLKIGDITPLASNLKIENLSEPVIVLDNKDRIQFLNISGQKLFRNDSQKIIGKPFNLIGHDYFNYDNKMLDKFGVFEAANLIKDNPEAIYNLHINPFFDNQKKLLEKEIIFEDITERKINEEKIFYLSSHDKLTGLFNRYYFEEEIKRLDVKGQLPLSIVVGDINGLKLINDSYGHEKGDILLKKVSVRLKENFKQEDIIARWGGDEFIIILPSTPIETALKIIDRIKDVCKREKILNIPLSISWGAFTKTEESQNITDIIKEAEDRMFRHKLIEKESAHNSIISSLEKALEERDYETAEHIKRTRHYALQLGESLGLPESKLDEISLLAALHDIGKIAITDNIILKPGALTPEEWIIMKKHPEIGYRIAASSIELLIIAEGILTHHERWDGKGYPKGLAGEEIPLIARIIFVVDSFDAMISGRPYRKALSINDAVSELKRCSGTQFDPQIVEKFLINLNL